MSVHQTGTVSHSTDVIMFTVLTSDLHKYSMIQCICSTDLHVQATASQILSRCLGLVHLRLRAFLRHLIARRHRGRINAVRIREWPGNEPLYAGSCSLYSAQTSSIPRIQTLVSGQTCRASPFRLVW